MFSKCNFNLILFYSLCYYYIYIRVFLVLSSFSCPFITVCNSPFFLITELFYFLVFFGSYLFIQVKVYHLWHTIVSSYCPYQIFDFFYLFYSMLVTCLHSCYKDVLLLTPYYHRHHFIIVVAILCVLKVHSSFGYYRCTIPCMLVLPFFYFFHFVFPSYNHEVATCL